MGRAKMVTRTILGTEAEVMVFSNTSNEVDTIKVSVGGQFDDDAKLLKAIEKTTNSEEIKVLKVVTSTKIDKLLGMTEADFLKYAHEIDPKTRKILEANPNAEVDTEPTAEAGTEATTAEETNTTTKKGSKK